MEGWCRHFTGIQHETCEQGIKYNEVRIPSSPARFPCIHDDARGQCAQFVPYTQAEIAAANASVADFLTRMSAFDRRETEDCPHCKQHVTALRQVGRCVYADPCGCRVWQGRIPEAWK